MPKILIASDHAGFLMKERLIIFLKTLKYEVKDFGAYTLDKGDDYPDFMIPLAKELSNEISENPELKGIILGGSGQGEAMAVNKFKNVRATVFYGGNEEVVKLSREHNNSNIISLGARFLDDSHAMRAIKIWLDTPFSGDERHVRRIKKINEI
ncbi:MAG: RpiB/LacA/LacB family sugar-phosphate isomerase [bacterium]